MTRLLRRLLGVDELELQVVADLEEIGARITELELRLAEAGRRAVFHDGDRTTVEHPLEALADVGRALLFDDETP